MPPGGAVTAVTLLSCDSLALSCPVLSCPALPSVMYSMAAAPDVVAMLNTSASADDSRGLSPLAFALMWVC